jgi:formate dehydrogenase subunit beta
MAPLAPVMPVIAARLASNLTMTGVDERIGVVMRDCEIRAVVELVKLQQAKRENLFIVGIDCLGTYEVADYANLTRQGVDVVADALSQAEEGSPASHEGASFRAACQMCEKFVPSMADLHIGLYGMNLDEALFVETSEETAQRLGLEPQSAPDKRAQVIAALAERRIQARDQAFAEFRQQVKDIGGLQSYLSTCIRCHNCMVNCPICYCKECIFRTPIFDHESEKYQLWAERKGAIHLPTDTLLFHITRLNHMVTSCVGCGMCDSACPSNLPIATMFRAIAQDVQAIFDYEPGRSLEEEVPVATFREDELEGV